MIIPRLDKTWPSVAAAVDAALRQVGGCPAYLVTDNEKMVRVERLARLLVRSPAAMALGRNYGLTVATSVPYGSAK